jgi:hypothetical protein
VREFASAQFCISNEPRIYLVRMLYRHQRKVKSREIWADTMVVAVFAAYSFSSTATTTASPYTIPGRQSCITDF